MGIERFDEPGLAARWCTTAREAGTLGLVPTMGALHEGHLTLVRAAAEADERVCASVFVNPLQFDDPVDLERYPRDLEADAALLEGAGCAMVFTGELEAFFPETTGANTIVLRDAGPGSLGLEGVMRPGHFSGVATIVGRLFELVQPTRAYFGEKDFQQTLVVRHVAGRLGYPEVVVCPTSREPDGLARSSRNRLLTAAGRERAGLLARALFATRDAWRAGLRDPAALEELLTRRLDAPDVELEYAAVRDPDRWTAERPEGALVHARALVAAKIDGVRLIDNLALHDEGA